MNQTPSGSSDTWRGLLARSNGDGEPVRHLLGVGSGVQDHQHLPFLEVPVQPVAAGAGPPPPQARRFREQVGEAAGALPKFRDARSPAVGAAGGVAGGDAGQGGEREPLTFGPLKEGSRGSSQPEQRLAADPDAVIGNVAGLGRTLWQA